MGENRSRAYENCMEMLLKKLSHSKTSPEIVGTECYLRNSYCGDSL